MTVLKEKDTCPICRIFTMKKLDENFIVCENDNCSGKAKIIESSDFYELCVIGENYLINES